MFDSKRLDFLADSWPIVLSLFLCASCSVTSVQSSSKATRSAASVHPSAETLLRKDDRERTSGPLP